MTIPTALVGQAHGGSFFCPDWELRVTGRCLTEDLDQADDTPFDDLRQIEIVKSFVKDRYDRTINTRQVTPLTCGRNVWVLSRGNDHRGGTWFDKDEHLIWLLAYGLHRSGIADDFFPYCKSLDAADRLLPDAQDYERAFRDRDSRFAFAIRLEAPMLLKQARENPGEHRVMLGGQFGACLAIEVADELENTVIAFRMDSVVFDHVPLILAAFHAGAKWDVAYEMPSRSLEPGEFAFQYLREAD